MTKNYYVWLPVNQTDYRYIRFDSLKQAVAYVFQNKLLSSAITTKRIEDWDVKEKE